MNHNPFNRLLERICYDPATIAFVALSVVKGATEMSAARNEAKATIAEGNIAAGNKAKQVAAAAATQRVSFLQSGLTLEGTPMNIIESTFNTGIKDINQIRSNYDHRAKNQITAGRTAFISSLASGFAGASMGSGMEMPGQGVGSSWNSLGQSVGSITDSSPTGPYMAPWG